jgi:membrane protease YdiL (CAAX protease family)
MGIPFSPPPVGSLPVQLFLVSLPEEAFFRGFLQQRLGNNLKGIVLVSALFTVTHLPGFLLNGDIYSVLTFFPSLVMGHLYMRRASILPSTIFHFFANIVFLGFSQ